ncbi:MAG: NYN domain-containing protein [Candidatus Hodarchaeales archaeon]|jgi:hypothetical protein
MNISSVNIEELASLTLKKPKGDDNTIRIVLDGNNIAYSSLDKGKPKISNLVETLNKLASNSNVDLVAAFISAKLRHTIDRPKILEEMLKEGILTQTPAEVDDDFFVLECAEEFDAFVVSNDLYRPQRKQYPWINEKRVPFVVVRGKIIFAGQLSSKHETEEDE